MCRSRCVAVLAPQRDGVSPDMAPGHHGWFAEPVIYLFAMGLGLGRYLEQIQGVRYITFIAPGLLATSTMFGATFASTWDAWFKMERSGVYHAAASTPLSVEDVALGEIMWASTRATIYGSAFLIIATLFGVFKSWWGLLERATRASSPGLSWAFSWVISAWGHGSGPRGSACQPVVGLVRNTRRNLPIWISSPLASAADCTGLRLR